MSEESKKWYQMTRPVFNSGFEDDEFWAYGQDGFQEVLDSFLGCDVEIYDKMIRKEPQMVRAIIQQRTGDTYNSTDVRQILCSIGVLRCGQYVRCDGALWLVSGFPDNNRIYEKAVLWKCKHTIRMISPMTGEIVEYPVYSENSTQYGTGESGKTHMMVGEDQHLIYLPYNEETIMIDDQFRFLMDKNHVNPSAYRVTRVDPVTYAVGSEHEDDGLIQWAVLEVQFNGATDNADLMVADYYVSGSGESEAASENQVFITLTDLDGDLQVAVGETKQIRVQAMDQDGNIITPLYYRLEYDFNGAASIADDTDGVITIRASDDVSHVGESIEIKVIHDDTDSEATMKLQITNW